MTGIFGFHVAGLWPRGRGENLLDSGAPFYDTYETADGKYVAIGSIEPKFYAELLRLAGLDDEDLPGQMEHARWPELKARFTEVFKSKSRDEWCALMEGSDVCFAPVLDLNEASVHPHNAARRTFVEVDGVVQPGPAPRFSRTRPEIQGPPPGRGANTEEALRDWGVPADEIAALREGGAIA
jgi:alpha-methylacyl-CoA racemase